MEATTTVDKPAIDRDVERLVHEIGEVIEKARPEEGKSYVRWRLISFKKKRYKRSLMLKVTRRRNGP